ncbi:MAG: hypothetical protein DRR16_02715 [Candidatus Parabeggiatoa sp. nov. 3]|nr:MAG: hypothetical protein DRR16_02715 [Gammaproteobacteria bacterium]
MIARKAWAIFFDAFILSNRPILNALAEYKFTEHKVTATTRDCPYGQPQGIAPTGRHTGLPLLNYLPEGDMPCRYRLPKKGGNHKGLPLRAACRGNPLWLPFAV